MSTPFFSDKPVNAEDLESWPASPDRESTGSGPSAYKNWLGALSSQPLRSMTLTTFPLESFGPVNIGGVILYKQDPAPFVTGNLWVGKAYLTDDTFPPSKWYNASTGVSEHSRIQDALNNAAMYNSGPQIFDMNQRSLGDCGFVSSFGAIALHPEAHNILFSSIYPPVYNGTGVYSVRFIIDGECRYMLIDDDLPGAGYSTTNTNVFWYFLIEKACAKLSRGYQHLGGGFETYMGITSSANTSISSSNMDSVWSNYILDIFQKKQHTTYQGTGHPQYLVGGHAYAVIDAAEWNGIRLMRLHNPWNFVKYNGPYSPGAPDWRNIPPEIQDSVFQISRFNNTSFWMPYGLYVQDIPKISDMAIAQNLPESLKSIANPGPIQG